MNSVVRDQAKVNYIIVKALKTEPIHLQNIRVTVHVFIETRENVQ